MIKYALLPAVLFSTIMLAACSSSSSVTPTPTPTPPSPTIHITDVSITLPSECNAQAIYITQPNDNFGYSSSAWVDIMSGVFQPITLAQLTPEMQTTADNVTYTYFLLGASPNDAEQAELGEKPSGVAHTYCMDSNNKEVPLTFSVVDASSGSTLSTNLNLDSSVKVDGAVILRGAVAQSQHIYLYKKSHPINNPLDGHHTL